MTSRWFRLAAVGMVLGLTAAACGDVSDPGTTGGGSTELPGTGETVRIAVNPWTGSAANAPGPRPGRVDRPRRQRPAGPGLNSPMLLPGLPATAVTDVES